MQSNKLKAAALKAGLAASVLLLGSGACYAQQQINLSANPASATLPDGSQVPMWSYSCGDLVAGSMATCAALNPVAAGGWSPVVITVPTGLDLQINLTNNLSFTPVGSATANGVPTSLTIVGQLGGGLGDTTQRTTTASPAHAQQGVTWATVNSASGTTPTFTPPPQGPRVQSFSTEVAAGATAQLIWKAPRPGTYLIESGTHPSIQGPMGLYGVLIVTGAPNPAISTPGTAYPNATYDADLPVLLSEIDPIQNAAVNSAVMTAGFSETSTIAQRDIVSAISVVSGGSGYAVGDPVSITGGGFSAAATAQVASVDGTGAITSVLITSAGSGYSSIPGVMASSGTGSGAQLSASLSLAGGMCSNGAAACYPPAVNYTPLYYLMNGVAFDKTHAANSVFPATIATPILTGTPSGNVLVRLVNAGLRMHVPSIVGSQTNGVGPTGAPVVTAGFTLVAEDGNPLPPARPRVQSEVFMAAGKTYDVMINGPAAGSTALPVYDRELSLSGNSISRDAGMLAYISVNGAALPSASALANAVANNDTYKSIVPGQTFTVSDPGKGVIANDVNVSGVQVAVAPTQGTLTLNANGTFTYLANASWTAPDTFVYCGNGTTYGTTGAVCATVTLGAGATETASGITLQSLTFNANMATYLAIKTPGVLAGATDGLKLPLTVDTSTVTPAGGLTVYMDANGGFTANAPAAGTYTFTFQAQNSQGTHSNTATVTLNFPVGSGLAVKVLDGNDKTTVITDYRWVIEEDQTFYVDPNCTSNPPPAGCPTAASGIVPTLGVNFHTSHMPFVAQGCTGQLSCEGGQTVLGVPAVCDISNGVCRADTTGNGLTAIDPSQVALDPTKRYYISVLPGDSANPFAAGYGGAPCTTPSSPGAPCSIGHGMGGAPITFGQAAVTVLTQPSPYPTGRLSVFVFEDDFPLNGEQDGGGGIDVLSPNEPGLGGFQIHLWDAMGGNGDFTGQMTYDMFNQPLTNSLDGTIDPATGLNACPITQQAQGITGMIVTCPKYESDGVTLSPLAGQAVVANLMPGRWGVVATPGADRIARGEEWLQTNTLDGQKAHDSFVRIGEPSFFQEFGPAGYHVSIGFANPAIINGRHDGVCAGTDPNLPGTGNCVNTIIGRVVGEHLSRTPDERLYGTGSHDAFYWTQCYVSFGDPDGEDFAFTKCNADGTFTLTNLPDGDWRVTTFDQWNDQLVDGLSTPVGLGAGYKCSGPKTSGTVCDLGDIAATQWQTNLYTRTFIDDNKDGISQGTEAGIPLANVAVRLRDGSLENLQVTDFTGTANFNETFPLFSWYTVETDVTRYKNTGTHVVYDVGGPVDGTLDTCGGGTAGAGYPPCGTSIIGKYLANTAEQVSLPTNLRVPGAVYCKDADCSGKSIQNGPGASDLPTDSTHQLSSGRIDPPWVGVEGWQGFPGQNNFLEFGKEPYVAGENGGIKGHVVYASTRPFDDPQLLVQTQWEPLVPHVTINLYQEGFGADGVTPTLTLVDTTQTSSWDDWAQGFHLAADGVTKIPNMNCPGQGASTGPLADLFFFSLFGQPQYLDWYNSQHGGPAATALPYNSQFKCYDGMHNWNQLQPAPYDGMYQFPSVTSVDPTTGKPNGTNCKICTPNPVAAPDLYSGLPMLPPGKYVVEVVVPPGFELVKEEDKNILIGDNFIAPVTQQFGGLGNVFILPDQASLAASANPYNPQNPTQSLGAGQQNQIVPSFVPEPVWPCVGQARIVPDYISLYPQTHQVSPFAGALRRLCDRKEVTLGDQMGAIAKFYVYTSVHVASKFTGGITDDYTSEFDPFSPQFGEKFAPPDLPVSVKDWAGNETNRVYADHWGAYNGMTYSTWEVNPPNPTGYSPTMMVFCMNDPGPILDTRAGSATLGQMITDPQYTQGYSQFCYELPFMPATTQYLDTPVVPTSAFAGAGYNNPDCAYPDATPAVSSVTGDVAGPWVSQAGNTLTINGLGDQSVPNYAYSGPSATTAPYNLKTVNRHYGFGAQCTSPTTSSTTCNTLSSVSIGGVAATITSWSDTQIVVTVPNGVPDCAVQQQAQYGGSTAQCGELLIKAGNGKQSIDTVTVTIGGKTPTVLASNASSIPLTQYGPGAIQQAIDGAAPGDMIIIPPGVYNEMLLVWKPVRLQGVGAATSVINANTHPAGKLEPWRRQVACLFGLAIDGVPITASHPYDPSGTYSCPGVGWTNFNGPTADSPNFNPQVDRLPLEATVGWDATLNGNLAELLQEPTLMGALEGAGVTELSKGVNFPSNPFAADTFPTGTVLLTTNDCGQGTPTAAGYVANPFPSNFQCNPSSIDGLGIADSSQGGGGIFVHAWGHNLQIANNRVANNAGTLSGGINIGQGEFPPGYVVGSTTNADPGSCMSPNGLAANVQMPYCHNLNVNVHNNYVSLNSSTGDELFSATPAGAGGVSFCTGADYYRFNYNWVCGNLSSGDGGGLGHLGFIWNGDIEHNTFLFNQSTNPTIPANGGAMVIMGAPDVDPTCGATTDADCVPTPGSVGPSDGVGPGLVVNANLIMGNAADSGSGGGIAFQHVNGSEVVAFPTTPSQWYQVTVTNNIIVDNVAGWDGAGISLLDALNMNIVNNTIASNSTTASSGTLFNTLGAPLASTQNTTNACSTNCGNTSPPQPAGLVSIQNSVVLQANLPATVTCPAGHYAGGSATNANCRKISYPLLANDVFWQNSAYYMGVGALSPAFQQNVVSLYNAFTSTLAPSQPQTDQTTANGNGSIITGGTGSCVNASYWEIGVRGDTGPGNHGSGFALAPTYSVLTDAADYPGANNLASNPTFVSQYCDGSRTPPELGSAGWQVPPGISDATVPNPIFNLTPAATVDEGNNWVNLRWGPLSTTNPTVQGADGNWGGGAPLGDYSLAANSPAIDVGTASANGTAAPTTDFFGTPRPQGTGFDIGAVEFVFPPAKLSVTPTAQAFGSVIDGNTSPQQTFTLSNSGGLSATGIALTFSGPFSQTGGTCGPTLAANANCTITVVFAPTAAGPAAGSLAIAANVPVTGSSVTLTGTGIAQVTTASVSPTSLAFGSLMTGSTSSAQTVTVTNTGNVALTGGTFSLAAPFSQPAGAAGGSCGAGLAVGASCTLNVVFAPATAAAFNQALTVAYTGATVTGSPVTLTGTGVAPVTTASVSPTSLAFGSWATGSTSPAQSVTVSNTGNVPLAGGTFTLAAPFSQPAGAAGGTCGAVLAVGAHCTINVMFAPTTAGTFQTQTLTVAYTGATITGSPVALSGTGVVTPAKPASVTPNPATITLSTGSYTKSQVVRLTNTAAAGGPTLAVTSANVPLGGSLMTWFFSIVNGADHCTGALLAPGQSCTVTVQFASLPVTTRGVTRTDAISFTYTMNSVGNSQTGSLQGYANP
jgi:Bacterial Ig domain